MHVESLHPAGFSTSILLIRFGLSETGFYLKKAFSARQIDLSVWPDMQNSCLN